MFNNSKKPTTKRLLKKGFSQNEINSLDLTKFKDLDSAIEHLQTLNLIKENNSTKSNLFSDVKYLDNIEESNNTLNENTIVDPPIDEPPIDETPIDENPTDENPTDENPTDENPKDENPKDENPTDENPKDENPKDETLIDEKKILEKNPSKVEIIAKELITLLKTKNFNKLMSIWNKTKINKLEHIFINTLTENAFTCNIKDNYTGIQFILNSFINSDLNYSEIYSENKNNFLLSLVQLNSTGYLDFTIDLALEVLFQKSEQEIKQVLEHQNKKHITILDLLIRQGRSDIAVKLLQDKKLNLNHPDYPSHYVVLACQSLGTTEFPHQDFQLVLLFLDHILENNMVISLEAFDIIRNNIAHFSSFQINNEIKKDLLGKSDISNLISKTEYKKPILDIMTEIERKLLQKGDSTPGLIKKVKEQIILKNLWNKDLAFCKYHRQKKIKNLLNHSLKNKYIYLSHNPAVYHQLVSKILAVKLDADIELDFFA